jgi:MFS family permease
MQLLRGNRSFRRLWAGQVVSELGNWFNFIAGLGLVRAVSGAAPEATAIMMVARLAPFAVLAPLAGACVDRWSRRAVMIVSDAARAVVALGFLLVAGPNDLWIAYASTAGSTVLAAFFEAARNAAMPNLAGDRGLLAGNALMFSSRFLLMSLGSALGGAASVYFGYQVAFVINALSFVVSAYSIWLIPESEIAPDADGDDERRAAGPSRVTARPGLWTDVRDGWAYIARHPLVAALIGVNVLWATGGGAVNLIFDRLGGVYYAAREGWQSDTGVAILYTVSGAGLFAGMVAARRVGALIELRGTTVAFIGWTLIAHGLIFALTGLMPRLWLAGVTIFVSRLIIGVEYAVQDTLLMRLLPDNFRGRVSTIDRAGEIITMSLAAGIGGWSLQIISPLTLAIFSGLLAASPGAVWLALFASGKLKFHPEVRRLERAPEAEDVACVSPG